MPEITETELKKQIERGTFGNLYLLHGEEKYLLKLYANRLIDKACGSSFQDFNLQKMDGGSTSIDEIADAVEALPLLAERPGSVFIAYTILYGKHCFNYSLGKYTFLCLWKG